MQPTDFDCCEVLRYLGVQEADAALSAELENCFSLLCETMQPRHIWRCFDITWNGNSPYLNDFCLVGRDIAAHLQGCSKAVLMAVTLSASTDKLIRRYQSVDMAKAVILDAAAGAAVEFECERTVDEIRANTNFPHMTERFSAGYGDFPLTAQRRLLSMLNAARSIGLTATDSDLLLPMKSVTAVIGLSNHAVQDARRFGCGKSCGLCPKREDCPFQK